MTRRTTDAHAAGIVDGEGSILIYRKHQGVYGARLDIGMTSPALVMLERLQRTYGGKLREEGRSQQGWASIWRWQLHGRPLVEFLTRVEPYLQVKQEQARLALRLEQIRAELPRAGSQGRWTEESRKRAEIIRRRVQELNRRGPRARTTTTREPFALRVAGIWVETQCDLFSDLGSLTYSGTFPRSGFMSGGRLFALPTPVPLTGEPGSSSSPGLLPTPASRDSEAGAEDCTQRPSGAKGQMNLAGALLLRTPMAQLAVNGGSQHPDKRKAGGHGPTFADEVEHLLPTPRTSDTNGAGAHGAGGPDLRTAVDALLQTLRATNGTNGGPNQRGSSGDLMLPSAVQLLPTPTVNDMGAGKTPEQWDEWTAKMQAAHGNGNGHGKSLAIEALRLLPTPQAADGERGSTMMYRGEGNPTLKGAALLLAVAPDGVSTPPLSTAGKQPYDAPLPLPPN